MFMGLTEFCFNQVWIITYCFFSIASSFSLAVHDSSSTACSCFLFPLLKKWLRTRYVKDTL
ncbi:hypothetical protein BJ508DRAFT_166169 [Ascobolus immersus RN42]|uniref:Uncharacterized protein n=1 Tax=Ascobolus immersus RN42 TaxID=1160509 RepID=A0A3N4IHM4_ASCIM|nr:hypothetical protein BJ508DRAFT_166169 [Ascobolus immersus RN42]